MSDETFLTEEEITTLTGRKRKSLQVEMLRQMGVAFFLNCSGRPIVTRSTIEGGNNKKHAEEPRKTWSPRVITANA